MVSKNAPMRMQSGGTQISRRTVARGLAWTAPVAAVAYAAPAFAASPCTVKLTLDLTSCKCPGNSDNVNSFVYFLKFCITDANSCGATGPFTVTSVVSNSGSNLAGETTGTPPNCGFPGLPISGTIGTGGCTAYVRLRGTESNNSAHFLDITYYLGTDTAHPLMTRVATDVRDCDPAITTDPSCTTCAGA